MIFFALAFAEKSIEVSCARGRENSAMQSIETESFPMLKGMFVFMIVQYRCFLLYYCWDCIVCVQKLRWVCEYMISVLLNLYSYFCRKLTHVQLVKSFMDLVMRVFEFLVAFDVRRIDHIGDEAVASIHRRHFGSHRIVDFASLLLGWWIYCDNFR